MDKGTLYLSLDVLFVVIQRVRVCIIVLERFIRRRRRLLYHQPAHC